ncbi:MAG: cupin domain-containing protein [Pseudomonadota bacterium]
MKRPSIFLLLSAAAFAVSGNQIVTEGDGITYQHEKGASVEVIHRADDALDANIFMAKLTIPAGGKVPEHRDSTAEYLHFLSGSGTMTLEGTKHEINPGDTVFMEKNALVSFQAGDEEVVVLQVFAPAGPESKYSTWSKIEN